MKINIGPRIEVIDENPNQIFFDGRQIVELKGLLFEINSKYNGSRYAEIVGFNDNDLSWEFAKELHKQGFHINYQEDGDWYELYLRNGKHIFEYKLIPDKDTGLPKNKKEERICKHCQKIISKEKPWCLRYHKKD